MLKNYTNLLIVAILIYSSLLQGMDPLFDASPKLSYYTTTFDEGFGVTQRFFSGRKNSFTRDDDTMDPKELLSLLLRNAEKEQKAGELSFEEFQNFYRGVGAALREINRDTVPESKIPFIDQLLKESAEIIQAQSYEDLLAKTRNAQWKEKDRLAILSNVLSKCTVISEQKREKSISLEDIWLILHHKKRFSSS